MATNGNGRQAGGLSDMFSNFINNVNQRQQAGQEQATAQYNAELQNNAYARAHVAHLEEQRRRDMERERRERGPPPASRTALKNIPEVTIAAHDLAEETNRSCSVCLDDHELGEKAVKLPCAHIFHRECVWEWLELHCTCPVCRFELETEDRNYEKERRVRMRGRRPRYRRRELDALTIPQIRNLARGQNVNIAGCLEKADIVRRIVSSGMVEVVESEALEYDAENLAQMTMRELRSLMLQVGIGVDGCLEKADLLERVLSSQLVTVTNRVAEPSEPREGRRYPSANGGSRPRPSEESAGGRSQPFRSSPSPPVPPPRQARSSAALESMSVKELRGIMGRVGVSMTGCIEKRDMVERIRGCGRYRDGAGGSR